MGYVRQRGLGDMAAITSPAQLADANGNVLAYDQGLQRFRMVPASQAKLAGCTSLGTNMGLWSVDPACGCVGQTFLTTNPATVPSNVDPRLAPCSFTPQVVTPGAPPASQVPASPSLTTPAPRTADVVAALYPAAGTGASSSGSGSSLLDSAMAWIEANPMIAAAVAGSVFFLAVKR